MKYPRALAMEFIGTALIAVAVVGSGWTAVSVGADQVSSLLINAIATGLILAIVIRIGLKSSGSHFNPAVTVVMVGLRKMKAEKGFMYIAFQILGAIAGVALSNAIYEKTIFGDSTITRTGNGVFIGEVLATAGLVWIVLRFPKKPELVAIYLPMWIFGAIIFTTSTAFANPALTIARIFTGSPSGIASASIAAFIGAQLIGALVAVGLDKLITHPEE
ncbi:MAG: aquaporin [Actinomycetes bacterium]|jgi:glycerol uptake facilitator-like aquaporin